MAKNIEFVSFEKFVVNMDDNNNVYLRIANRKDVKIGKNVDLKISEDKIDINVRKSKETISNNLRVFSKDILFLESNPNIKKALKNYFKTDGNSSKEVFVLDSFSTVYIGESISDMDLSLKALDEAQDIELTKNQQKEILKAYETPTNMYDVMFSLMEKGELHNIIDKASKDILSEVKKDIAKVISERKKNKEDFSEYTNIQNILKNKNANTLISSSLIASYNSTQRMAIEADPNSHLFSVYSFLNDNYSELMEQWREIGSQTHPFTKIEEKYKEAIPTVPIIDLQAGSGKGILTSATNSSFPMQLQGTEFRKLSEMGIGSPDERYNVLTNRNFLVYKNDYNHVFRNGSLHKAVVNTPVYLNPPYNSDNKIAMNSIEVLKQNQQFYGLFPTSMKSYIADNMSGHIFEVSRELTGYTDPKTPETFLFVVGTRYDEDYVDEIKANAGAGLLQYAQHKKHNFFKGISSTDVDGAVREMLVEINRNRQDFPYPAIVKSTFEYYKDKSGSRLTLIQDTLESAIAKTDDFLSNSKKIKELFDAKKDDIQREFGSENMLKKEKVFPNVQMFSEDGKMQRLSFFDVIGNQGLLVAYRDNYPEILDVIEKIAKSEEIELDILRSNTSLYNLENPYKPEQKDRKTTANIGLMKNYYLPSSFSLSEPKNKEHLLSIISDVFESNGRKLTQTERDDFSIILDHSDRMITKYEQKIKEGKKVLKEEVFVFVDEDGVDIAKLDVSKTDFYKSMEKLQHFDINDYIELAELSSEKKAKIMQNFMKHMENVIHLISDENKIPDIKKSIFGSMAEVQKLKKAFKNGEIAKDNLSREIDKVYIEFMRSNGIDSFFANRVNFDNNVHKKFGRELVKNVLLMDLKKKDRAELVGSVFEFYNQNPLDFFEYKRAETEEKLDAMFKEALGNVSEKDLKSFKIDIYNSLSQDFTRKKAVFEAGLRTSKMLISNYGFAKYKEAVLTKKGMDFSYSELYDELYKKIASNTLGLMSHQIESPERFLEISDEKKLDLMMWEMRAGKTLGFSHEMYLLSLYQEEDGYMFLESKNIDDISLQLLSHMPHVFASSNFYLTGSKVNKSLVNEDVAYHHLNMADFYPNLPSILQDNFVGRGEMQKGELKRFGYEFEELIERISENEMSKEEMMKKYSDSKFLDILNIGCMKN